jgi:NAD(P)-dependent dehydrogenase (short-subunit alcohol dehydrogenase family)
MLSTGQNQTTPTLLLIAASRGLGLAIAEEFLKKNWNVIGTVRSESSREQLDELRARFEDRLEIETLDVCEESQIAALRQRLSGRKFEMLFVNAGITNRDGKTTPIGDVSTDDFIRVMTTNSLAPMRVIERLESFVSETGLIGVMSSGRGSLTNNTGGEEELYRGSKSALNQFMRSYAARHSGGRRSMILMAPGWVRTELGGPGARLSIEESVPNLVNVLVEKQNSPGLSYLDYLGRTVPW